ncbi:MAG: hypothetical protein K8T90_00840 [Planctomycetes bacterium]|nr:hypothetical protein [Planctomycetota bacterium]
MPIACAITGADPARVLAGRRTSAESEARGVVAFVACDVAGFTMVETATVLGVRPTALLRARPRGRAVLADRSLAPTEVLARSCAALGATTSW